MALLGKSPSSQRAPITTAPVSKQVLWGLWRWLKHQFSCLIFGICTFQVFFKRQRVTPQKKISLKTIQGINKLFPAILSRANQLYPLYYSPCLSIKRLCLAQHLISKLRLLSRKTSNVWSYNFTSLDKYMWLPLYSRSCLPVSRFRCEGDIITELARLG